MIFWDVLNAWQPGNEAMADEPSFGLSALQADMLKSSEYGKTVLSKSMNQAQPTDTLSVPADIQSEIDAGLGVIEASELRMMKDQEEIDFLRVTTLESIARINRLLSDVETTPVAHQDDHHSR